MNGWSADVATAFLQGLPQQRKAILGCQPESRMALIKPVYGQLDAPRRWWLEAKRRLTQEGWRSHELDPCLFTLHHEEPCGTVRPCGMICLHVDDMLGAGDRECQTYLAAESRLKEIFDFRTWQEDSETMEYCGVTHNRSDFAWSLSQKNFIQKVKPVTVHRGRGPEDEMNEHDRSQLRALLGSLQWPAVQSQPHLQCSASLISGQQKTNKLRAIIEGNSLLRFAKENSDVTLRYEPFESIQSWQDLSKARLNVMFDAAHAVREDHSSQGGYIAFITPDTVFHEETSYHVVDWRSFKLHRVARSSLSAEAQAAGQASDASEYIARFWSCIMNPNVNVRDRLQEKSSLCPTLITDAKALYDAFHKESSSTSSSVDKRTYLEIRVAKQQVTELGGSLRWVSSERQYADGLTKTSTRSLLADRWRDGRIKLVWDPGYVSAKKKTKEERDKSKQEFATEHRKKRTKTTSTIHKQQPTTTNNTTQAEQESEELEMIPVQAVAWKSTPSSLKIPLAVMVCYTQVKAVMAGDTFIQAMDDNSCPVEQEYFWSPLTVLCTLLMLFSAILSFVTYKLGRFLERRHWRSLVNTESG